MQHKSHIIGYRFEEFCYKLFEYYGIGVEREIRFPRAKDFPEADFVFRDPSGLKYLFEVKFYSSSKIGRKQLRSILERMKGTAIPMDEEYKFVVIIGSPISNAIREEMKKENLEIIDISNLLYLVSDDSSLTSELTGILSETLYDWNTKNGDSNFGLNHLFNTENILKDVSLPDSDISAELVAEFKNIEPGKTNYRYYEKHCFDVLKYLFSDSLSGWKEQNRTYDGFHQMDLVCRAKRGNEFWDFLIEDFNSRYILFEFKNYSEEIKQTQIYTTEKYLFQTALRTVCFIISRRGPSESAKKAVNGVLRETGKLMIPLSDDDLIVMINHKDNGLFPEDYLFEIVDDQLLSLEK